MDYTGSDIHCAIISIATVESMCDVCPSGYSDNGATCFRGADSILSPSMVADCPSGYTNTGLTCYRGPSTYSKSCTIPILGPKYGCRAGYIDNGCLCGRGASSLGPSSMVCPGGYFRSSITAHCGVNRPAGYTNTGETFFRGVSTLGMGSMLCKTGEERILARCFPNRGSCFGNEEVDAVLYKVDCAAGCAKTSSECALAVVDQVIAPLILTANIATLGMAKAGTTVAEGTVNAVRVGNKFVVSSTRAGRAFLNAVNLLQSYSPGGLVKGDSVIRRLIHARTGRVYKVVLLTLKVERGAVRAMQNYRAAYAEDFAAQTSVAINNMLDTNFAPATALFLKEAWSDIQVKEMAEANGWQIADVALSAASVVDITGIMGVVNAYAKPTCGPVVALPCAGATALPFCLDG
eukprot:gene6153-2764_t